MDMKGKEKKWKEMTRDKSKGKEMDANAKDGPNGNEGEIPKHITPNIGQFYLLPLHSSLCWAPVGLRLDLKTFFNKRFDKKNSCCFGGWRNFQLK